MIRKSVKINNKNAKYESKIRESVNTPPSFKWKDENAQKPESEEEVMNDKFPFSEHDQVWYNREYTYPTKPMPDKPSKHMKTDNTVKHSKKISKVNEMIESRYEQLIEGYRDFKAGDDKPSKKIKSTIQEIAKKLQEIETLVNYNSKLKTESGVTSSAYGPNTTKALSKISERLIKISERIRSLGE